LSELGGIPRGKKITQGTVRRIVQNFAACAHIGSHYGNAGGKRFNQGDTEAFVGRHRKYEQIPTAQKVWNISPHSEEVDAVGDTQLYGKVLVFGAAGAVAY
jgi:hypothetical protein